jgi:uncharacterized protein (DUF1697 family)
VALIRGINVGRAKRVAMADLRGLMERLGFTDCRTLLNSGNLVFAGGGKATGALAMRVQRALADALGVAARVIAVPAALFLEAVDDNPLPKSAGDPTRILVVFVQDAADLERLAVLEKQKWAPESLKIGRHAAYLWCPAGVGKSPLWTAVDRTLGESGTARNWATVKKVAALLGA